MTVVLATNNTHKVQELQQMFADAGLAITLRSLKDLGITIIPDETGTTFEENAYIKARTIHEATGLPVLADDSGLEVSALGNAPGVHSARYAGPDASDADNRHRVVSVLTEQGHEESPAAFRCVLCYIDPLRTLFGEGACHGTIGLKERGANGFGYDPLFTPDGHDRTFAELSASEKHAMSHRGRALQDLLTHLRPLLTDEGSAATPDPLPKRDALLMASVAAVTDNVEHLRTVTRLFVRSADDARALYEALLQSYLFAGFPVALESLAVLDQEVRHLIHDHVWPEAEAYDVDVFRSRGEVLCEQIYTGVYERMMERLQAITPDLSDWMIVEGYGKTLSRPGLDVVTRELCNVAILAVLRHRNQLVSHVRGSLNVGATITDLEHCADAVTEWGSAESGALLRSVIDQFRERS